MHDDQNELDMNTTMLRLGRLTAFIVAGVIISAPVGLHAQTSSVPGLVVTTTAPPPGPLVAAPPPAVAPAPANQPPAAVKPKPKPTAKRETAAATGSINDGGGGAQGIVALVNDEPITAYEVHQRAQFMTLTSDFTERAKANMKSIAENPKTPERVQEILKETIAANPGK